MSELLACLAPHRTLPELQLQLDHIRAAPKATGSVAMIVCRPAVNQRAILQQATLDKTTGLAGDNWQARGYRKQPGGAAHPDMQLNLMNVRAISAIAAQEADWPLAGDQLFVDLDLSSANLPPGTHLKIGSALIEVTAEPHLGCKKFAERYGHDAVKFVNSATGKALNLRGINARIVASGSIAKGDLITVIKPATGPAQVN